MHNRGACRENLRPAAAIGIHFVRAVGLTHADPCRCPMNAVHLRKVAFPVICADARADERLGGRGADARIPLTAMP